METYIVYGNNAGSFLQRILKYRRGYVALYRKIRDEERFEIIKPYHISSKSYYEIVLIEKKDCEVFKEESYYHWDRYN